MKPPADQILQWVSKREEIAAKATEAPWSVERENRRWVTHVTDKDGLDVFEDPSFETCDFTSDARNTTAKSAKSLRLAVVALNRIKKSYAMCPRDCVCWVTTAYQALTEIAALLGEEK